MYLVWSVKPKMTLMSRLKTAFEFVICMAALMLFIWEIGQWS